MKRKHAYLTGCRHLVILMLSHKAMREDFPHRPVQEPSMRSCDLGHHWPNEEDVMAKNNWGQLFLLVFIVDQLRLHTTD